MSCDPDECRRHALRCAELAAECHNPSLKKNLVDLARAWAEVAMELETSFALLDREVGSGGVA